MIFGRSVVIHPMHFGKRVIVTFPVQMFTKKPSGSCLLKNGEICFGRYE